MLLHHLEQPQILVVMVTVNVGKRISTALTATGVFKVEVIDKPVTDTSSLGANAVPCCDVM